MGQARNNKYDSAIEMYSGGLSVGACAEHFGITRQAMHKILKRRGCEFRPNLRFGNENHFFRHGLEDRTKIERAHDKLEKAVASGKLVNPGTCENCSADYRFSDGRSGIQAHHDDYNKPLLVRWLCQKCHHAWHRENAAML